MGVLNEIVSQQVEGFCKMALKSDKGITGKSLFKKIRSLEIKNFYINANWSLFNRKISLQVKGASIAITIRKQRL